MSLNRYKKYREETKNVEFVGQVGNCSYNNLTIEVYRNSDNEFKMVRYVTNDSGTKVKGEIKVKLISKDRLYEIEEECGGFLLSQGVAILREVDRIFFQDDVFDECC